MYFNVNYISNVEYVLCLFEFQFWTCWFMNKLIKTQWE